MMILLIIIQLVAHEPFLLAPLNVLVHNTTRKNLCLLLEIQLERKNPIHVSSAVI